MKIGISGPPGSGKSKLAKGLAEHYEGTEIVDEYVEEIGKLANVAVGPNATYISNLFISLWRIGKERALAAQEEPPENTITCGTLIDSSVYASMDAVTGQSEGHWIRIHNYMNITGTMYQDTFDYVPLLYLPSVGDKPYDLKFDQGLKMALEAFGWPCEELPADQDKHLETAISIIDKMRDDAENTEE